MNSSQSSDSGLIYFNIALAYEKLGIYNEAIKRYTHFINKTNDVENQTKARLAIGRIAVKKGNLVFAEEYYRSILKFPAHVVTFPQTVEILAPVFGRFVQHTPQPRIVLIDSIYFLHGT